MLIEDGVATEVHGTLVTGTFFDVLGGAESLLMSLWPVSDSRTERQMRSSYQSLKLGKGCGDWSPLNATPR